MFLDVIVVLANGVRVELVVRVDHYFRAPFQVWFLLPDEGHRPPQLHVGKEVLFSPVLDRKHHFSFSSVDSVAIEVTPPGDPSLALPPPVPPGD